MGEEIKEELFYRLLEKNKEETYNLLCHYFQREWKISIIVIKQFELNLLERIYINGEKKCTLNGKRRKLLRKEEVKFIKIMEIINRFQNGIKVRGISLKDEKKF